MKILSIVILLSFLWIVPRTAQSGPDKTGVGVLPNVKPNANLPNLFTGPAVKTAPCIIASTGYQQTYDAYTAEKNFCSAMDSADKERKKYRDAYLSLVAFCAKILKVGDFPLPPDCHDHVDFVQGKLELLENYYEAQYNADRPTCEPHLAAIKDLSEQLNTAKQNVCSACGKPPSQDIGGTCD